MMNTKHTADTVRLQIAHVNVNETTMTFLLLWLDLDETSDENLLLWTKFCINDPIRVAKLIALYFSPSFLPTIAEKEEQEEKR